MHPLPNVPTPTPHRTRPVAPTPPPPHYIPWRTAEQRRVACRQDLRQIRAFDFDRRSLLKRQLQESNEEARARDNERYLQSRTADPDLADLNPDQRRAVLIDDDRCLIVAGAGTGKTHTITAKIRDLVRQGRAAPHEIAVITFTTKATRELRKRLADLPGIEIGTIHHLARTVIANLSGQAVHLSRLTEDDALRLRTITGWLRDTVFEQTDLISDLALRRSALKSVRVPPGDTIRPATGIPPDDIQVRSVGEARIAITLWLCGIEYRYETQFPLPPDEGHGRTYHPDFFIPDDPGSDEPPSLTNGVWLEHYAFGTDAQLPPQWENERPGAHAEYREHHQWKQALHKRLGTRFVTTSFADIIHCTDTGTSFASLLAERLSPALGRPISPPDEARVTDALSQLGISSAHFNELAFEIDHWIRTTRQSVEPPDNFIIRLLERADRDLTWPLMRLANAVLRRYLAELEATETNDHEGTILQALRLTERRGAELPWVRLLIDEWQDVNPAQAAFVHAIARTRPARLTAVGDDWQSVYSFQGSDVELIRRFEDPTGAFAPPAQRTALTHTYRHGQRIADTTRAFILATGHELDKTVIGHSTVAPHPLYPARFQLGALAIDPSYPDRTGLSDHPETAAIQIVLNRCAEYPGARTVLLLGRQRIDFQDVSGDLSDRVSRILNGWRTHPSTLPRHLLNASPDDIREYAHQLTATGGGFHHRVVNAHARRLNLKLSILTIHSAKGLEADLVILLDRAPHRTRPDRNPGLATPADIVLRPDHQPEQEERRIWYVALTRSRQAVFVLVPGKDAEHSPFADELWRNTARAYDVGEDALAGCLNALRPAEPCPVCAARGRTTMALAQRSGPTGGFVGCTSYTWGIEHHCGYTERRCQTCGEGIMARQSTPADTAKCQNPRCARVVPLCRCDVPKPMLVRTNRSNGSTFYGCQNYPKEGCCNHTINLSYGHDPQDTTRSPQSLPPLQLP